MALGGDEFDFADECAAPSIVNAATKIAGHEVELFVPALGIGGNLETTVFAAKRVRVGGEGFAYDLGPRSG